jgi:transglutaminase-like putative cysteine protease
MRTLDEKNYWIRLDTGSHCLVDDYRTQIRGRTSQIVKTPKSLPLYTDTHQVKFEKKATETGFEYRWNYFSPRLAADEASAVPPIDKLPRIVASTMENYEDLGRAYSAMVQGKVVVTPAIQAKADEITSGIHDKRYQARAIYEWVSKHIRYVAIYLGNGGLTPHDPYTILANRHGDCKDHTVLFDSLLKAKGIVSEVVLINAENVYSLSGVGVL